MTLVLVLGAALAWWRALVRLPALAARGALEALVRALGAP